jgi:hypothetical protein
MPLAITTTYAGGSTIISTLGMRPRNGEALERSQTPREDQRRSNRDGIYTAPHHLTKSILFGRHEAIKSFFVVGISNVPYSDTLFPLVGPCFLNCFRFWDVLAFFTQTDYGSVWTGAGDTRT